MLPAVSVGAVAVPFEPVLTVTELRRAWPVAAGGKVGAPPVPTTVNVTGAFGTTTPLTSLTVALGAVAYAVPARVESVDGVTVSVSAGMSSEVESLASGVVPPAAGTRSAVRVTRPT